MGKMSQAEQIAVGAGVVVVITGLWSLNNDWGILMAVSAIAGIGVLAVAFQPQFAPTMSLPGSRGSLLLALGVLAVVTTGVTALGWLEWIAEHLLALDTIQFLVGLVAAVVMAWSGRQVIQGEGGKFTIGSFG
jgi:hypothetical protein